MHTDFYSRYYKATATSGLHSQFCREVFGIDLCQHGFADVKQLDLVRATAALDSVHRVLDLGCGTGLITEYLQERTGGLYVGIDNEPEAIRIATERTAQKRRHLSFLLGDINKLELADREYDAILLIDSIYFSVDYEQTIGRLKAALTAVGCVVLLYSIGPALLGSETFPRSLLEGRETPLAEALRRRGFEVEHQDLTEEEYGLALRRKAFLVEHEREFLEEGLRFVWENRMGDSREIIRAIEAGLHRRYLYKATVVGGMDEKGGG
jgi:SAM-dependent methyltransferase